MKRTRSDYLITRSKKPKLVELPNTVKKNIWINATDIKNYFLKDTLVDWLKTKKNYNRKDLNSDQNVDIFIQKGKEFEREIVKYINEKKISVTYVSDKITDESCQKVIDLMKAGTPIIHSAPFIDKKNRAKGVIDLLVRSDLINVLTNMEYLKPDEVKIHSPNLGLDFHYIVVDIKFSTLPLKSDGVHLLNSGNYEFYKGQLFIYTNAVGNIQGYTSRYAFVLGRRWKYTNSGSTFKSLNCLDRLGKVDFKLTDSHIRNKVGKAINWLKDLKNYGKIWDISQGKTELFPNMCVDSGIWNVEKKEIAERIGEITQIWNCGIKNRERAMKNGIITWKDPRCDGEMLGLKGENLKIVNSILNVNRNKKQILPSKISTNIYDWRTEENEAFVDFETFIDIFSDMNSLPVQEKTDMIYLIGLYYKGEYIYFLAEDKNDENKVVLKFKTFLEQNQIKKLWFWHAEEYIWKSIERKYNLQSNYTWCDLSKLFKKEPITVSGCFDFSLKNIGKALFNNGLISLNFTSNCQNGSEVSLKAWKLYGTKPDNRDFSDILKYNKYDVELLSCILEYFRKNM